MIAISFLNIFVCILHQHSVESRTDLDWSCGGVVYHAAWLAWHCLDISGRTVPGVVILAYSWIRYPAEPSNMRAPQFLKSRYVIFLPIALTDFTPR
jgi:hypothetical protein